MKTLAASRLDWRTIMTKRLYTDLSEWWPLMSPPADYAEEADEIGHLIGEAAPDARHILELGSGGGHLAANLKTRFDMTLVDLSPAMLAVSKRLNPDCRHLMGDMRTFRLNESFDIVLIHDAVMHMASANDLAAALVTARTHLEPGGIGLFCPDCTLESYKPGTSSGGSDGQGHGMRFLEWDQPIRPGSNRYRVDLVYLLKEGDAPVRIEQDGDDFAVYAQSQWLSMLCEAGFSDVKPHFVSGREVFLARAT
jgi:SAM-dependent methyltransferase